MLIDGRFSEVDAANTKMNVAYEHDPSSARRIGIAEKGGVRRLTIIWRSRSSEIRRVHGRPHLNSPYRRKPNERLAAARRGDYLVVTLKPMLAPPKVVE